MHGMCLSATMLICCLLSLLNFPTGRGLNNEEKDLVAVTIGADGFSSLNSDNQWIGFYPDIVKELSRRLHMRIRFKRVSDGRFGSFNSKTNKWDGMIKEVLERRVDFAAAPLTLTAIREEFVDFSHSVLNLGLVVVAKPANWVNPAIRRDVYFFLYVFDVWTWLASGGVFVITGLAIHYNSKYNPREMNSAGQPNFSLSSSFFFAISSGFYQGFKKVSHSVAGRCISASWWIFVTIFMAAYVGGFLCVLISSEGSKTRHMYAPSINIRDKFSSDPEYLKDYTPAWIKGGSTDHFFSRSNQTLIQQFNRKHREMLQKSPKLRVHSTNDLINLVRADEKIIGVIETPMADFYVKKTNCEIVILGDLTNDISYGFAFPPNSTLTGVFNLEVMRLKENGFTMNTYRKYFGSPGSLCGTKMKVSARTQISEVGDVLARMFRGSIPITLNTFIGPIVLYFIGLGMAVVGLLVDLAIYHGFEKNQRQNSDSEKRRSRGDTDVSMAFFED